MADDDKPEGTPVWGETTMPATPAMEKLAKDRIYESIKRRVLESGVRLPRPPFGSFLSQRWAKVPTGLDVEVAPPYAESSKRFWPGGEEPMRATREETEKFWNAAEIEGRLRRDELRRSAKVIPFSLGANVQRAPTTLSEMFRRTDDIAQTIQPNTFDSAEMTVVTLKARNDGEPDANGNVFPSLDGLTFAVPRALLGEMLRERLPVGVSMSFRSERPDAGDPSKDMVDAMAATFIVPPQTPERIESFEAFTARFGELKRRAAAPPSMSEDRALGITRVAVPKTAPSKKRHHPRRGYSYRGLFGSWAPKILARLRRAFPDEAQFFWPPSVEGQRYLAEWLWPDTNAVRAAVPFLYGDLPSRTVRTPVRPANAVAMRLERRAALQAAAELRFNEANAAARDLRDAPADKLAARAPGTAAVRVTL